jgi:hypothetical protein
MLGTHLAPLNIFRDLFEMHLVHGSAGVNTQALADVDRVDYCWIRQVRRSNDVNNEISECLTKREKAR